MVVQGQHNTHGEKRGTKSARQSRARERGRREGIVYEESIDGGNCLTETRTTTMQQQQQRRGPWPGQVDAVCMYVCMDICMYTKKRPWPAAESYKQATATGQPAVKPHSTTATLPRHGAR